MSPRRHGRYLHIGGTQVRPRSRPLWLTQGSVYPFRLRKEEFKDRGRRLLARMWRPWDTLDYFQSLARSICASGHDSIVREWRKRLKLVVLRNTRLLIELEAALLGYLYLQADSIPVFWVRFVTY